MFIEMLVSVIAMRWVLCLLCWPVVVDQGFK